MVDPSIGATMEGEPNRVCVRDHAGNAALELAKRHRPENKAAPERD